MSTDETKLPLRDRLAARLHELQCDRMKCDEQCKDDYEYEAADEIIAMFSTEQPEDAATDVHRYDSDSDMFADLDRHRAGLNETGQAEGTPCCHAGNIGHEGDCVNETVATNDALIGSLMRELMSRRGFQVTITTPKRDKMWAIETAYLADSGSDHQDGFLSLQEALEYGVKVMREYDDER